MDDRSRVEELIGRPPRGEFTVVVRDADGDPVVVRNAPFLDDGTPMPTRYYLVGTALVRAVSRIEAAGGVRRAEAEIAADDIARAHASYADERDAAIAEDHEGPRPYGGVGGTRHGVKCLHAHLAHVLAGGDDPVGRWTLGQLDEERTLLATLDPPPRLGPETAPTAANPDPGGLTVHIDDSCLTITMTGGGTWKLDVGPVPLRQTELADADPPHPADLTNALGTVHDHLDDVIAEAPLVADAPSAVFSGPHAESLAMVELGTDVVPSGYRLTRATADEVFRTLVAEPARERRFNPGLRDEHVETIIPTLCVVLAFMRRLDLGTAGILIEPVDGHEGGE